MRVIAGSARHLPLKTIEGPDTRPTTDRIKETLFNMIQFEVTGSRFLDLFSGSGAIGIEALSRGAREAVFVERERKAAACIEENLRFTKLADKARLMKTDVSRAIISLNGSGAFDIIFMDPPYDNMIEKDVLTQLVQTDLVSETTLVIVEASLRTDFDYLAETGWEIVKRKEYKTNMHMFLRRKS